MACLTVSLLGSLDIKLDGQSVAHLATGKARALLAYLAVEADRPHRRETLSGLLWPDWPDRSARANLRNALSNLRTAIGDRGANKIRDGAGASRPFLLVTRETVQFNRATDCWIDVTAFEERAAGSAPEIEHLEEAIALYRGPFLEGFAGGDSPAFDD
jgi:DNA-binding SARP family transcriptional activator